MVELARTLPFDELLPSSGNVTRRQGPIVSVSVVFPSVADCPSGIIVNVLIELFTDFITSHF